MVSIYRQLEYMTSDRDWYVYVLEILQEKADIWDSRLLYHRSVGVCLLDAQKY